MSADADLVVVGKVVVAAEAGGLETADAVAISGGRVVAVGTRDEAIARAGSSTRIVDAGDAAVIPGLTDFHLHLVALARARGAIDLDGAGHGDALLEHLADGIAAATGEWVRGRGWSNAQLGSVPLERLQALAQDRPVFLTSHDGHSAWASPAARRLAGLDTRTPDPPGGRIERDATGEPTGVLRERAMDLVEPLVSRPQGAALHAALGATVAELSSLGITGACEAGDYTDANGIGTDSALGDSYSTLTDLAPLVDGRLRLTLGIPARAMPAAAARGLRTGAWLTDRRSMRFGWAKEYADGALGSGTAALFEPRTCAEGGRGLMRVSDAELDRLLGAARSSGIALAIHAIGDRAAASVLEAIGRSPARARGVPDDRVEHLQLLRASDLVQPRALGVTASVQPIHAAADRDLVEDCWADRADRAYAWRSLVDAGARLVGGSDAPVESVNPWLGIFAAVHRRLPSDPRPDWHAEQSLTLAEALEAYTLAAARAIGVTDEGHLRVGARADVAVLSVGLDTLLAADERLAEVRSILTLVDGSVMHEQ